MAQGKINSDVKEGSVYVHIAKSASSTMGNKGKSITEDQGMPLEIVRAGE